mgnify:FL=1
MMTNFITTILIPAAVIEFAELVRRLFKRDFEAVIIIAGSAAIGVGLSLLTNHDWTYGLVAGLSASGVITGLQKFGDAVK